MFTRPTLTVDELIAALTAFRDGYDAGDYPVAIAVPGPHGFTSAATSVLAPPVFLEHDPSQAVVLLSVFPPEVPR